MSVKTGTIINIRKLIFDPITYPQEADTILQGGNLVYYDSVAEHLSVVPIAAIPHSDQIMVVRFDSDNSGGALGDRKVECYKTGCRAIVRGTGAIEPNSYVQPSNVTAGSVMLLDADDANFNEKCVGIYRGHVGETTGINKPPTDAADGEDDLVVDFL